MSDVLLQDQRRSSTAEAAGEGPSQPAEGSSPPEPASGPPHVPLAVAAATAAAAAVPAFDDNISASLPSGGGHSPGAAGDAQPAGGADLGALRLQLEAALAEVLALRAQRDEALQQVITIIGVCIIPSTSVGLAQIEIIIYFTAIFALRLWRRPCTEAYRSLNPLRGL